MAKVRVGRHMDMTASLGLGPLPRIVSRLVRHVDANPLGIAFAGITASKEIGTANRECDSYPALCCLAGVALCPHTSPLFIRSGGVSSSANSGVFQLYKASSRSL